MEKTGRESSFKEQGSNLVSEIFLALFTLLYIRFIGFQYAWKYILFLFKRKGSWLRYINGDIIRSLNDAGFVFSFLFCPLGFHRYK